MSDKRELSNILIGFVQAINALGDQELDDTKFHLTRDTIYADVEAEIYRYFLERL